ncbi:basic proline-rich protein-like, partial [Oxyura jamaicensis]|uniref:basic proline-rich protein-like n=1 Tax=Oxyura jamaicensis TaxID=8884 RepID=UPI0015A56245
PGGRRWALEPPERGPAGGDGARGHAAGGPAAAVPPAPAGPRPGGGGGSPRSPRRETFVVKDSPVRALLPTVPPAREDTPSCHPPPAPKGPPPGGRGTLGRGAPPRLCPPRGAGAAARGKSEPLRKGTAGQPKARGGGAAAPPTRAPRTRATTAAVPVPSSRPPPAQRHPQAPRPGWDVGDGAGWEGTPAGQRGSTESFPVPALPPGAGAAPGGAGSGCRPAPPRQPPAPTPEDDGQQHPA